MTDRPTPAQIIAAHMDANDVLMILARHGYVIVHPDDVPHATHANAAYSEGWSDCRTHIFGETP